MKMITFKPLEPADIEVRVQQVKDNGCSLLLYKDARCDMRLLDEAVGSENWDCSYELIGVGLFCTVGIRCQLDSGETSWVYKQDVGTKSDMEPTKGEASDAFKRACFKWGIGRELYTAPYIWVDAGALQKHKFDDRRGKWICRDKFKVKSVTVKNGAIADLAIENDYGLIVYQMRKKRGKPVSDNKDTTETKTAPQNANKGRFDVLKELKQEAISLGVKEDGIEAWISANIQKPKRDMTDDDIKATADYMRKMIESAKAVRDGQR